MSESSSTTFTESFTVVHARHIASKVAADLQRFQDFYGAPATEWISRYEAELVEVLKYDVLGTVTYGFKRDGLWTRAAVKYVALPGGTLVENHDPGRVKPNLDVAGASFTSYLTHNDRWWQLSDGQRASIRASLPFQRGTGNEPPLESGRWETDKSYLAGGRGIGRSSVR
ncbi:hypothetical protein PTE30175_04881 [Pandoraea terrae]|uniref:Bacterial HORMA domain-containing protein n=1 Tax=Pandoraea terrae TaxID=1537710 RepID=A0A5E4Z366_9BURK|nr:hypothetical protein [Pandoraea terrae]VVE55152.1 hypothetical protein PTE30175_04881 [Pandoraea terrae]